MAELRKPSPGSAWPTFAWIVWGLVVIALAMWLPIAAFATGFGTAGLGDVLLAVSPLAGPLLAALACWTVLAATPARAWAQPVKSTLIGSATLLGIAAMPFVGSLVEALLPAADVL
ncbi:hypothetical protein [Kitasatospora sp. NPDC097643]|uniref:hypothetical protein n=1 Tax=Kitasatospora sp. NPDC097643 TaxID=3157230 RepID=UPI003333B396